jgi:hypothetical protein
VNLPKCRCSTVAHVKCNSQDVFQLLLPDYCKYRLDSAGTKIANTTRPSLPIMYGSERARTGLQLILCVEGLYA